MPKFLFRTYFFCQLLFWAGYSEAQKNIIISDDLATKAEKLKVKMGTQWMGKIWKFSFGNYAVVSSKMGWTINSTKGNLFHTKTESKSTNKFSFVLAGKAGDSAQVNAAENIVVKELHEIELFPHFYLGSEELILKSNNFSAIITLNNDTSNTWALFMNVTVGQDNPGTYEGFITNGTKKIILVPASSNNKGEDNRPLPALGFEFLENGQSIGALQYYGGGAMGMNKNIVWISKDLDATMKLLLAAAMTAVLQVKVTSPGD